MCVYASLPSSLPEILPWVSLVCLGSSMVQQGLPGLPPPLVQKRCWPRQLRSQVLPWMSIERNRIPMTNLLRKSNKTERETKVMFWNYISFLYSKQNKNKIKWNKTKQNKTTKQTNRKAAMQTINAIATFIPIDDNWAIWTSFPEKKYRRSI